MSDSDPTSSIPTIHSRNELECIDATEHSQVLRVLNDDIRRHPEKLIALDQTLMARLDALISGIHGDINSPLSANDE